MQLGERAGIFQCVDSLCLRSRCIGCLIRAECLLISSSVRQQGNIHSIFRCPFLKVRVDRKESECFLMENICRQEKSCRKYRPASKCLQRLSCLLWEQEFRMHKSCFFSLYLHAKNKQTPNNNIATKSLKTIFYLSFMLR